MSDPNTPMFGPARQPCATCGSLLASDQRYCLACGTRRADARLPFLDILRGSETELVPFGQPLPLGYGGAIPPRDTSLAGMARANAGLIAGVGVLLLAMLIGVLIGSNFNSSDHVAAQAPAKPQIIQIAGAAPAAATTAATDTTATTPTATSTTPATTGATSAPAGGSKATNKSLGALQNLSGKDYQKQVDKLGKTISTGGKPPPKDNKAPAAGGSFQEIG